VKLTTFGANMKVSYIIRDINDRNILLAYMFGLSRFKRIARFSTLKGLRDVITQCIEEERKPFGFKSAGADYLGPGLILIMNEDAKIYEKEIFLED